MWIVLVDLSFYIVNSIDNVRKYNGLKVGQILHKIAIRKWSDDSDE